MIRMTSSRASSLGRPTLIGLALTAGWVLPGIAGPRVVLSAGALVLATFGGYAKRTAP